jgi:hypothetical protein
VAVPVGKLREIFEVLVGHRNQAPVVHVYGCGERLALCLPRSQLGLKGNYPPGPFSRADEHFEQTFNPQQVAEDEPGGDLAPEAVSLTGLNDLQKAGDESAGYNANEARDDFGHCRESVEKAGTNASAELASEGGETAQRNPATARQGSNRIHPEATLPRARSLAASRATAGRSNRRSLAWSAAHPASP